MNNLENKIKAYQLSQRGLKKALPLGNKSDLSWLTKSLILGALPSLGAVTSLNAQCQPGETTATYAVPYANLVGLRIDVDGDGTDDFEIQDSPAPLLASLHVDILNGGAVLTSGGSGTVKNYSTGQAINGAAGTNTFSNLAWLVFNPGLGGPWGGGFPSSGYIGIKQGGFNGFIQLTVHQGNAGGGNSYEVTVTGAGLANASGNITAGDCSSLLLPVEFISFDAITKNDVIFLEWATASEENNAGFQVERSLDGQRFEALDFVESEGSNSYTQQNYEFVDDTAVKGKDYYYRLRQIDFDGKESFSEIVSARIAADVIAGELYPNPSSNEVNLDFNNSSTGDWEVGIYDVIGKQLSSEIRVIAQGNSIQRFNLDNLADGVYFLKMKNQSEKIYRKIVVANSK